MATRLGFLAVTVAACVFGVSAFGQGNAPPTQPIEERAAINIPAKVTLLNRTRLSGAITDFESGGIEMTFHVSEDNPSLTLRKAYPYATIARIDLATPNTVLQKHIVNTALSIGNAILAYNIACSVQDDPDMKALAENQDFPKAIAAVPKAKDAYDALARRVQEYRGIPSFQLSQMRSKRDAAKTAYEKAQAAVTTLCQQTLGALPCVKDLIKGIKDEAARVNKANDDVMKDDTLTKVQRDAKLNEISHSHISWRDKVVVIDGVVSDVMKRDVRSRSGLKAEYDILLEKIDGCGVGIVTSDDAANSLIKKSTLHVIGIVSSVSDSEPAEFSGRPRRGARREKEGNLFLTCSVDSLPSASAEKDGP